MQIQPILGYFSAILGLYQPPGPPFWISAPPFTYPGSAPVRVHRLGVQNWKKRCVFGHIDKFKKGYEGQIKKNACKNAYLGSIFMTYLKNM